MDKLLLPCLLAFSGNRAKLILNMGSGPLPEKLNNWRIYAREF